MPAPVVSSSVVLNAPSGLAINGTGDLFIADTGNNCVRQIASLATYKTAVGKCSNDSSGSLATALNKTLRSDLLAGAIALHHRKQSRQCGQLCYRVVHADHCGRVCPNGASGPYSPTQDGNSALSAPLNGPRGIAVDSFGNFSLADSSNSIARKLNSNIIFPSTPVGSQSATMPLTFLINQNVNLSVTSGPDFSITSNNMQWLTQSCTGRCHTEYLPGVHSLHSDAARASQRPSPKLTDSLSG